MTRALIILDDAEEGGGIITQVQLQGGWNPSSNAHRAAQDLMTHLASLAGVEPESLAMARPQRECTHFVLDLDGVTCALCGHTATRAEEPAAATAP